VLQPRELAKKIQLLVIGSRQRTYHQAIDEPCTLPLSAPKGGTKQKFLHLVLPYTSLLQVIVDISYLICGSYIANPNLQMTKCPRNGHYHVT